MPLILIAGNPCTGKTTFANQLLEFLRSKNLTNIELINEESLKISKKDGYKSSFAEKSTRGSLKSAADHKLNAECYVIIDSLNYIKGFRYELYCSARTFRTPHCVVWVECNEVTSNKWNSTRIELNDDAYDAEIMSDLRRRFEAPNDNNRWDSPLFKVNMSAERTEDDNTTELDPQNVPVISAISEIVSPVPTFAAASVFKSAWKPKKAASPLPPLSDDSASMASSSSNSAVTRINQDLSNNINPDGNKSVFFSGTLARRQEDLLKDFCSPGDAIPRICAYLLEAVAPSPNSSTIAAQHADADLLYELDRTSQRIAQLIAAHQTETVEGTPLKFAEFDRELTLHRHAGLAELQRHRRQFVKINGQHPPGSSKAVGASFIDFLALQL